MHSMEKERKSYSNKGDEVTRSRKNRNDDGQTEDVEPGRIQTDIMKISLDNVRPVKLKAAQMIRTYGRLKAKGESREAARSNFP